MNLTFIDDHVHTVEPAGGRTRISGTAAAAVPVRATLARLRRQRISCVADFDPQQFDQGVGRAVGHDRDRLDTVLEPEACMSVRK